MLSKELVLKAIESAKCRIYKLNFDLEGKLSAHHQQKAENQKELMNITVEALTKQIPVKPSHVIYTPVNKASRKHHMVYCGVCGKFAQRVYIGDKYCRECGTRIDWSEDEHTK